MQDEVFVGLTKDDMNVIINGLSLALNTDGVSEKAKEMYMDIRDKIVLVKMEKGC